VNELILIVDDEVNTLKLLGMALEREGYRISAAQDARTALERVAAAVPDLAILDVMMPGVSGLDLCQQLRARRETANLPIILLSAKDQVADRVAGLKAGADEYLVKPIDPVELIVRVASLLERTRRLRAEGAGRAAKTISFIGAKGGSGTTSVVLNVGTWLASQQAEVVAVELRGQAGSFATLLGLKGARGLDELAEAELRRITAQEVARRVLRHASGLQVVCPAADRVGFERMGVDQAQAILAGLRELGDYVLVDLPSIPTAAVEAAIPASRSVVLLVEPVRDSVERASAMASFLQSIAQAGAVLLAVAVTRAPIAAPLSVSEIEERLAVPVAAAIPPAPDAFARAANLGRPVILTDPSSTAAQAFVQLAGLLR